MSIVSCGQAAKWIGYVFNQNSTSYLTTLVIAIVRGLRDLFVVTMTERQ